MVQASGRLQCRGQGERRSGRLWGMGWIEVLEAARGRVPAPTSAVGTRQQCTQAKQWGGRSKRARINPSGRLALARAGEAPPHTMQPGRALRPARRQAIPQADPQRCNC